MERNPDEAMTKDRVSFGEIDKPDPVYTVSTGQAYGLGTPHVKNWHCATPCRVGRLVNREEEVKCRHLGLCDQGTY